MGKGFMKISMQHFAEPAGVAPPAAHPQAQAAPSIDYDKLAQLVAGKQSVTEDSVLKGYFKQQGLSEDEVKQAISAFKQQKAANQPDVNALQQQAAHAREEAQRLKVENAATFAALELGLDTKTIPYVLKVTDLSGALGEDGLINEEAIKAALGKVLEDVPALKPAPAGQTGFIQVGMGGSIGPQQATEDALKKAFGL